MFIVIKFMIKALILGDKDRKITIGEFPVI